MTQSYTSLKVTFSVVAYNSPYAEIERVVRSILLYAGAKTIYIVDNSPVDKLSALCQLDACVRYKHFPENLGFGVANNWAMKQAREEGCAYHFVVNPDIYYDKDVVAPMIDYLEAHPMVGELMPRILSPDGSKQHLPKLIPSPLMLLQRQLSRIWMNGGGKWMERFEMRAMRDDRVYEIGQASGCFVALRMKSYEKCGGFDPRYFLYFEDADLCRNIHKHYVTAYFPMVSVYHEYGRAASKNMRHFMYFLSSCVKYFCKWGWFFDKERRAYNRFLLSQL